MEDHVRVVDRVFDIIEQLAQSNAPLSLAELAETTQMSKSTLHRLLASMCARHYVEKKAHTYSIGYKMIETVSLHINGLELLTEAKPFLGSIMRDLGLTAHLGILDGSDVVYLEKIDVYPNTRLYTQVGYRSPAFCSSIGKCLLACLSGDELDETLYKYKLKPYTPNTIIEVKEFKRHLKLVRKQGWAMDNEEYQIGHRCVGAPIFDYRGSSVAAISVSGSIENISDSRLEMITSHIKKAAIDISKRMGYME